jgi:hypothetical protein
LSNMEEWGREKGHVSRRTELVGSWEAAAAEEEYGRVWFLPTPSLYMVNIRNRFSHDPSVIDRTKSVESWEAAREEDG